MSYELKKYISDDVWVQWCRTIKITNRCVETPLDSVVKVLDGLQLVHSKPHPLNHGPAEWDNVNKVSKL